MGASSKGEPLPPQAKAARSAKDRYKKLVPKYHAHLEEFKHQSAFHEGAVSVAFQTLLSEAARLHRFTLIPQLTDSGLRPDGTIKDANYLVRGHWEAKDTSDDLDAEIAAKIRKGYPTGNIIFEDTRRAVLYQNGKAVDQYDLRSEKAVGELLDDFFAYREPQIEQFEKAVAEFKERVPELARGLDQKIKEAHAANQPFQKAFDSFFELCKTSLNPNISQAAVDEMLIQHLLTERLIRNIFDDAQFDRRNVIAAEIEKVIDALSQKAFSRADFLRSLDRFYLAIESAARTMPEFADKQHFLNTVYERFFQGYSVKLADTMGIVYTPQPIVDFMCASVAEILEKEFGKPLGHKDVYILDPCTGTGNFIVNLIRRIPKRDLSRVYKSQLFANEIMLLPYYIASLNIEHAYYEQTGGYESFEGLCFVDTLDLAEAAQSQLDFMTEANTARVRRQKSSPITVIIGNPPYNYRQVNENDNNKNRKYPVIDGRVADTYVADSTATNRNALGDAYVRFFRWAVDRLEGRDGIVCLVTNNSFVDQVAFDGMRKHLLKDFTYLYHADLNGNVRVNPKLSGTTHNVFGIQVGVGITVAVRATKAKRSLRYSRVVEEWRRDDKLAWLAKAQSVCGMRWRTLTPDERGTWLVPENSEQFTAFIATGTKDERNSQGTLFDDFSLGVTTARDDLVYGFDRCQLVARVQGFIEEYNSEVDRYRRTGKGVSPDEFVRYDRIKWSRDLKLDLKRGKYAEYRDEKIRRSLYRPFCRQYLFYDTILNEESRRWLTIFPGAPQEAENAGICTANTGSRTPYWVLMTNCIPHYAISSLDATQCFPFYVYDEDGSNRRENITDWALQHFREHYGDKKITKWDIFYYVYGLLHHPGYREKFADNLKRELPRIPLAPDFRAFAKAGKALADLHLNYEQAEPFKLEWVEMPGEPLSYRVEKMKLTKDKRDLIVNKSLTLRGIPPEVFDYRLGNRSALDWVIDQYQVSTDKRSGITSDPNRDDDPEYIVRLVGQVVGVSVETVKLVKSLPTEFADPPTPPS